MEGRRQVHFRELRKETHHNIYFQRAFDKHDENAFGWTILEYVENPNILISREDLYLKMFWPTGLLYNTCPVAGSPLGVKRTEETCRKIREAALGRWSDEEQCQLVSKKMLELWADPEYRQMMTEAKTHISAESRQKYRKAMLELWKDEEYRQRQLEAQMAGRHPCSDETKQRQREAALKLWSREGHRQRVSEALQGKRNPMWGKHHTAESNQKNSKAHKGKKQSPETIQKRSEAMKRYWAQRKRAEDSGGLDE